MNAELTELVFILDRSGSMIVCPNCGEQVSEKARKCVHCGAILIPEEKKHCMRRFMGHLLVT